MTNKLKMGTDVRGFALMLVFATNLVAGQDKTPEALANILKWEGYWEGPAKLFLDGKTYEFQYMVDFKKTADESGLLMEEWFSDPELGNMKGSNLIGYNTHDSKIQWFSVDNMGTCHVHFGYWKSKDHFYMQADEMMDNKAFVEKINMVFKGNDRMDLNLTASLDGQVIQEVQVRFQRVKKMANK